MQAPMTPEAWGAVDATSNGAASELTRGRNLLAHGLEDPWAVPSSGGREQRRPATAGQRVSWQRQAAADDWGPDPHGLGRRSRSLTLDEAPSFDQALQPMTEAASARSWMKPFGRKKKAAQRSEEGASAEPSTSASGRTTFTSAQLQRAASAGLPGGLRPAAATSKAADADTAAAVLAANGSGEKGPGSSGRRLWSRSSEHVAGKERPPSVLSKADAVTKADAAAEPLERANAESAASGSRWNPFSRGTAKPATTTPTEPPLLASAGAQPGTDGSSASMTGEVPSSSEASRRSSLDPDAPQSPAVAPAQQITGQWASPFAAGAAASAAAAGEAAAQPADEPKPPSDDGKKGHRRGRSLSSMLNPLKMKGRRGSVADDLDIGDERSGRSTAAADIPQRPKTPDPAKRASSGALGCFGGGPRLGDDDTPVIVRHGGGGADDTDDEQAAPMPPGLVGLKNLGNTCFINAAVQCLRHTPGLALTVLPDLLSMPPISDSEPPTPKAAATDAGGSVASSVAESAGSESPKAGSLGSDSPTAAGVAQGSSPQHKAPAVLGVVRATDSPVASIAAPEALAATPEDRPLIAEVKQSPPVSFSSGSHGSESKAATAAAAAVAAGSDGGLLEAAQAAAAAAQPAAAAEELARQSSLHSHAIQSAPSTEVDGLPPSKDMTTAGPASTAAPPTEQAAEAAGEPTAAQDAANAVEGGPAGGAAAAEQPVAEQPVAAATETSTVSSTQQAVPQQAAPQPIVVQVKPRPPPEPLQRGELLDAFKRLVREVYGRRRGSVDPVFLVRRLGALGAALGEDFTDGGQHDCEEVLSAIIDRLHEDLNRAEPPEQPQQQQEAAPPATPEPAQRQHSSGSGVGEPGTPATPQTPSLARSSHRLAMAGSMGRDSVQLGFGLRSLSLSSSVAEDDSHRAGEPPANGAPAPSEPDPKEDPNEPQDVKAERMWKRHLEQDDSPMTDLFGGQLQGNITCHGCKGRFTRYEFFKGLSLPLVREARGGLSSWFSSGKPPSSITDCLAAFTSNETLRGNDNEYYSCDECKGKTAATLNMRIHRFPRILMLHIKRFTYTGTTREKLTTNVAFPLKGLKLGAFASEESGHAHEKDGGPEYDLYAVINHTGTMTGGHYVATCRLFGTKDQWHTYNDEVVVRTPASAVATANAYILFYVRRDA